MKQYVYEFKRTAEHEATPVRETFSCFSWDEADVAASDHARRHGFDWTRRIKERRPEKTM